MYDTPTFSTTMPYRLAILVERRDHDGRVAKATRRVRPFALVSLNWTAILDVIVGQEEHGVLAALSKGAFQTPTCCAGAIKFNFN